MVHAFLNLGCCSITEADKGKVKMSVEVMKIAQDKNTKAEQTVSQKKEQTVALTTPGKVSTVKTQARQETITVKINTKDYATARKSGQPTVGQVLLKHKGNKQEEARKGRTTVLASKELSPKSEAKQVMMKEGVMTKAHATADQLQDQPQINVTLGAQKVTNGTAKVLTLLTKVMETSNVKNSLHLSTLAEKDVTQSSANSQIKEVKTGSVNASNVVQTVNNTKTQASKISSGKAILSSTTAGKDKQTSSGNQTTSVKKLSSDVKPALTLAKTVLSTATKNVTGGNKIGKEKHVSAINQKTSVKTHSTGVKTDVLNASKTVKTTVTTDSKDKPTASVSQKTSLKTLSDLKPNTETTILTEVRTTQSRLTKPATVSGATTITKDKFATSVLTVNQSADAKSTKDTPVNQLVVAKSSTTNVTLSAKDKATPMANHTAGIKSHGDGKAAKTQTSKAGSGKAKGTQKSKTLVNVTSVEHGESSAKETVVQVTADMATQQHTSRKSGGGLGSVKVSNVTSYSFTLTWSAPPGMFKNFTVIRREQRMEAEGTVDEDAVDRHLVVDDVATTASKNTTAGPAPRESTEGAASSAKATSSRGKAEEQRISLVLPGNVRAVDFDHLQANTRYLLQIFGTASGRRSKIHRTSVTTGRCLHHGLHKQT